MKPLPPDIAKITRPKASRLIARPRLFAALDEARQGSATWVSAPPGFGKTSLASSYVEQHGFDCLWYRVDEEDADAGNFFYYLNQAGKNLARHKNDLPSFTPENLPSLGAFARRFFENLCLRLRTPAILVFDEYEELGVDSPLHGVLAKVVEHLPEGIHILFLSREQPPAAFARLRTHGAFAHIQAEALRLTQEEAQAFAARKGLPSAGQNEILRLNELTGGWAAGLMLLLMRGNLPLPEGMPGTASLQVLFDYFSQEVFRNLEPSIQNLLLKCAILPEMPLDAVERATGSGEALLLLDRLSAKNYFTTLHDGAVAVYRFHPLFRAFLLEQVEKAIPREQLVALQKKAARVLAQGGHTEGAIALMHACEDWDALAQIVLTHAEQLARQGRLQTLESWIRRLPAPVIERSPWLLYWLGTSQLPRDPIEARATLLRAYALFDLTEDTAGLYLCWSGIASIYFFVFLPFGEALAWISTFEDLQRRHPNFPSQAIEARVVLGLVSLLRLYRLDHSQLPHWLSRGRGLLGAIDDHSTRLLAGGELAWCYSWLGKTAEVASLLHELAPLATADMAPLARLNWLSATAMYAWHRADAAVCAESVAQALRIADESDVHVLDAHICVFGVYGALSIGDASAAKALQLRIGNPLLARRNIDAASFHHLHTLVDWHLGNFQEAEQHARQTLAQSEQLGIVFICFVAHVCLASILVELGHVDEAGEHLTHAARMAQGVDSGPMAHLSLLGKALLEFKRGRHAEALEFLRGAIESAKDIGGHYTPFYHRDTLAALYALGLEVDMEVSHLQAQIRLQRLVPQAPERAPENWPWPVKIYTLGRFAIAKDGAPLKTGAKSSHKPVELLKTLIAHGGRAVHQDKFIAALWPDTEGDDAHHAFETTLYRLRKLLGAEALIVKDGQLTLDHRHCWVDCWAFERLASSVTESIAADDFPAVARDTHKLLNIYQGTFLNRDQDIPAAHIHGERLRSRLLRALESLGQYWAARRDHPRILECYLRALEVDPRAEVFYQHLMRHYHAQGRYPEAIAVYQRCRLALHSLTGVTPSADTNVLHASALAAAADYPPSPVPAED